LRIILKLRSSTTFSINFEYHSKIQGFLYSILKNTSFDHLHDKKGYKFFSFSNIFKDNSDFNLFNLIISSPSCKLIREIAYYLQKIRENNIPLEIGNIFELKSFKILNYNLSFPIKIITASPIIIRIPSKKFSEYSENSNRFNMIYWRDSHLLDLFIEFLESNLKKKYYEFCNYEIKGRIFEQFTFKKQVSTRILIRDRFIPIIGSLWEFSFFNHVNQDIQLFALDCGLGERNSMGFGFMNPIKEK
jgi:CRISPR-associated endoribonuclease Cas6